MAFRLRYAVNIDWIGDGVGPGSNVPTAQTKGFTQQQTVLVPGGDAPTLANFNTALTGAAGTPAAGSMGADLNTQISAALAQIQAFATGGG
jgi:hypothetical protein